MVPSWSPLPRNQTSLASQLTTILTRSLQILWGKPFLHTKDDADRHIQAYIITLLGSLQCRTEVQLADGKAFLLKHVSSYVTKIPKSASSECLYCTDVTGYQEANCFLRTVKPLEPEMIFQLTNIKVCWTKNDCFVLSPFPRPNRQQQGVPNVAEADNTLPQWLRSDRISGPKPKVYDDNKVLIRVKFVFIFNPIHFYKHLTMHYPHQSPNQLHHAEEESMPPSIKFFAKAIAFTLDDWATAESLSLDALSYSFTRHLCQFLLHGSPFGFQRSLAIRHHYVGTA